MSRSLQLFLLLAVLLYFVTLASFIRKKRLLLKYTLLWIVSGAVMLVLALFPGLLDVVAGLLGISTPVNALFAIALFCVIIILVSLTAILSHHNASLLRLIQENALLEQRIRALEARAGQETDSGQGRQQEGGESDDVS